MYDKPLNVKNISFCSRVDKYYNFIPNLYIVESNIQRLNITFKKHMELTKETNEKLHVYYGNVRESKEKPHKLIKEVIGEKLYIEIVDLTQQIITGAILLMIDCYEIEIKHKKIMKEMYPKVEFKEYKLFDNLGVDEELITNLKKFRDEKILKSLQKSK